jgi:hypothetical protein
MLWMWGISRLAEQLLLASQGELCSMEFVGWLHSRQPLVQMQGKLILVHVMEACGRSGGKAPVILISCIK